MQSEHEAKKQIESPTQMVLETSEEQNDVGSLNDGDSEEVVVSMVAKETQEAADQAAAQETTDAKAAKKIQKAADQPAAKEWTVQSNKDWHAE